MNVYSFDQNTGEFLGKITLGEGDRNPFNIGEFLIPANAVKKWPTVKAGENQVVIFNGSGWSLSPDFRGVQYWDDNGEQHQIEKIGELVPEGASLTEPMPEIYSEYGDGWDAKEVEAEVITEEASSEEVPT